MKTIHTLEGKVYVHVAYGLTAAGRARCRVQRRALGTGTTPTKHIIQSVKPVAPAAVQRTGCDILSRAAPRRRRPRIATDEWTTVPPPEHMGQGQNSKPSRPGYSC
jgi:hypothetical protein